jgi:hypothetical protein
MAGARQFRSIFTDLASSHEFAKNLADEIAACAARDGRDLWEMFFLDRGLPPHVVAIWSTPGAVNYLKQRQHDLKLKQQLKSTTSKRGDVRDLALRLIDPYFKASDVNGLTVYRVTDVLYEIVEEVPLKDLWQRVAPLIRDAAELHGIVLSRADIVEMTDLWCIHAERIPEPAIRRQKGEPGWCFSRATIDPDPSIPIPHWRSFLDRLNDGVAFAAWFGGCYYQLMPRSRQIMYVSEDGEGAKSVIVAELRRLMGGNAATKSINAHANTRFFTKSCVGKCFAVVPDNSNPRIIMSGVLKEISGADTCSIEGKFEPVYDAALGAKVLVVSNLEPDISRERSNITRTLWLILAPLAVPHIDVHFPEKLEQEAAGFLAYCLECFKERCVDEYRIEVNDAVKAAVELRIAEFEQKFVDFYERHFVDDATSQTLCSTVLSLALARQPEGLGSDKHEYTNFVRWLRIAKGIVRKRIGKRQVFGGMRQKMDATFHSSAPVSGRETDEVGLAYSNWRRED